MIRRPPRSTPLYSSAASDVYKRQVDVSQLLKVDCLLNPALLAFHHRLRCSTRLRTTRCDWRSHQRHRRRLNWRIGAVESDVPESLASEALCGPSIHVGLLTWSHSSIASGTLHVRYPWSEVAADHWRSSGLIERRSVSSLHRSIGLGNRSPGGSKRLAHLHHLLHTACPRPL